MPRFHFNPQEVLDGVVSLSEKESRHAVSVLRLGAGDVVELLDGAGNSFRGVVTGVKDKRLSVSLDRSPQKEIPSSVSISLAPCVIKPDPMELLIQKVCELGVDAIHPIISERTVVRVSSERWESKTARWNKIAVESCKQCGRKMFPSVEPPTRFSEALKIFKNYDRVLIPTLAIPGASISDSVNEVSRGKILILIGPEGDFSEKEVKMAIAGGAKPVTLGALIMRSETAAIYVLACLNFFYREIARSNPTRT